METLLIVLGALLVVYLAIRLGLALLFRWANRTRPTAADTLSISHGNE
jgi:Kef-type K+ transport system membrane component KefB